MCGIYQLPEDIWATVVTFVVCPNTRLSLRLACKTTCRIVDRTCKTVDLWDKFHFYRKDVEEPTSEEMNRLLQKLPQLSNVDMFWHTKRGFCEAAKSIINVTKTHNQYCCVAYALVNSGSKTTYFDKTELQSLLDFVSALDNIWCVCADVVIGHRCDLSVTSAVPSLPPM